MANQIPLAYADVRLQLATAISISDTSFTLSSATDDDGNALPAGKYCFTIDNGSSNKEYLIGQLNGVNVTSAVSVSRQGVESAGASKAHRVGASVILSDFATIQRVADILRGQEELDGSNPIVYDAEPTLSDRKEVATVGYVLDTVSGGTVTFDEQVIAGNAGETVAAGDLVYFKTSDQEWYLTDADTAATVDNVQLGIALGAGSDGVSISGGVQIAGTYTTTSLTAGDTYYASNTAGEYTNSAGTVEKIIGLALSTTKLLILPHLLTGLTADTVDALAGGGDWGTPSATNLFLTQDFLAARQKVDTYTSTGTWTKPTGAKAVFVQVWGAGGSGGKHTTTGAGGGGGGGYASEFIIASALSSSETVTVGTGGTGISSDNTDGNVGGSSSFGSYITVYGGGGGAAAGGGGGGGSVMGAGATSTGSTGHGGGYINITDSATYTEPGRAGGSAETGNSYKPFIYMGGGGGGYTVSSGNITGGAGYYGGGGGAGGGNDVSSSPSGTGGTSVWGGAGGGGCALPSTSLSGGTSTFGGAGGAGNYAGTATSGSQPGGGGGGSVSGTSGAGGDGKVIVTTFF